MKVNCEKFLLSLQFETKISHEMKVKIHQEGQNIIFVLLFILLAINVLAFLFIEPKAIPITLRVISIIMFALVLNFFRLPQRHFKGESDGIVVSSVDGKVVALEEVYEGEYLHRNCIQLSVFMSVFNMRDASWLPICPSRAPTMSARQSL